MKKIYIEPKTEMIVVKLSNMITGSDPDVDYDKDGTPIDAGSVGSRRRNYDWDDDDYDF